MTGRSIVTFLVVVLVAVLASCGRKDAEADRAAVRALVEKDTVHFKTSTSHDSTGGSGYSTDGDTAVFWWRGQQTHDSTPTLEVAVAGDSAWVDWSQHNYGEFYVLVNLPGDSLALWTKQLKERTRLRGTFIRIGREADADRGWRLRSISLATGVSDPENSVRIDSLGIASSLRSLVIAGPLDTYYRTDSLVAFTPGERLTLTLYTNATAGKAFLHTFVLAWPFYVRVPFEDQGNGVFTGTWHAQVIPSFRFGIFDLMARNTIYSPDGPYDSNGWLFPYFIRTAD